MSRDDARAIVQATYPEARTQLYGMLYIVMAGEVRVPGLAGNTEAEAWANAARAIGRSLGDSA